MANVDPNGSTVRDSSVVLKRISLGTFGLTYSKAAYASGQGFFPGDLSAYERSCLNSFA